MKQWYLLAKHPLCVYPTRDFCGISGKRSLSLFLTEASSGRSAVLFICQVGLYCAALTDHYHTAAIVLKAM